MSAPVILVCGSRSWTRRQPIRSSLERFEPDIVIEGGAPGADRIAREVAHAYGIHVATVPAIWANGRKAGPARNRAMIALKPDLVLAFWDGRSRGTAHTIQLAREAEIPLEIWRKDA